MQADPLSSLSKRERLIATKFAEGMTYREIGEALFIAPSTVRTHIAAIYRKLEIRNKAALVRLLVSTDGAAAPAIISEHAPVTSEEAGTGKSGAGLSEISNTEGTVNSSHVAPVALPVLDKPSIAVLPFANMSGDARNQHFADGITEDIITDLSRFRDLFVIARNSTSVYKDKPTDVRQIARELSVQYVLEGSLQIDGERARVSAQLVEAVTGNHFWSESYERRLDNIFAVQDEITQTIAASLAGQSGVVARAGREVARRKPPANLQAYEYYVLGLEANHILTEEGYRKAQKLFQNALSRDPNFARAYVGLAWSYNHAHDNGWGESRQESLAMWLEASKRAVTLDPLDGEAHMILGWYYQYTGDLERARDEIQKALRLNPNNADVLVQGSAVLSWLGMPEQAVEAAERAMRLNPFFPDWYYGPVRDAYFHAGDFEKSLLSSKRRQNITFWDLVYRPLCYAQLGRNQEAVAAVARLLRRDPDYSAEKFLSEAGTYARDIELNLFLDSHRKAGLPLRATEAQRRKYPDVKRLEQCEAKYANG